MPSQKTPNSYGPGWRGPRFLRQDQRRRALLEVTGQLGDLVHLRVPLAEGIAAMALDAPSRKVRTLLFVVSLDLKNGLSLHEALARRSNFFPASYVDTVRAGEESGRLDQVMDKLADSLIRTGRFQDDLAGHLIYLKFILFSVLAVGTMANLLLSSQFREIFNSFGRALPVTMQWLVTIHHSLLMDREWVALIAILLLALILSYIQRSVPLLSEPRRRSGRLSWRIATHLPWIGRLYRARDLAHVAQQLETLTWAGLPMDKALGDVALSQVSPAMARALTRLSRGVNQGLSFSAALARERTRLFPHLFRGLVQLGEQAGSLSEALGQLAQIYQNETLHRARLLLNVGAPLGVCCVGAYVFVVCHSFYGVLFSLSSLVIE